MDLIEELQFQERLEAVVEENSKLRAKLTCMVCMLTDVDALMTPCNYCVCLQCGKRHIDQHLPCPRCRNQIASVMKMFMC